ncbi:MAG TPA: TolC family protein [Usitatibacter sp.]|nr:TolC family protein [Usitatibacter sp.]
MFRTVSIRPARTRRAIAALAFAALAAPALAAPALSLDEALKIAQARSPQLAAQQASARAAAALVPAAGENPDPQLFFGVENVPAQGPNRWSLDADSMTMKRVGVMQQFVRGEKREEREARADAESRREAALLEMQRADLKRDVAIAWLDRYYAQRQLALVDALAKEIELQSSAATADLAAGRAGSADAIMARSARAMLADRRLEIEGRARRAEAMLARWIGKDASRAPADPPDVTALGSHGGMLEKDLEHHPHLAMYGPMEAAAEADLKLAEAAKKPDWSLELSYGQRSAPFDDMVTLMVRVDLPIFQSKRQAPVVASKEQALEQVRAQAEDARARHLADIRAGLADWDIAKARVDRQKRDIVPLAEERARLVQSAYAGGRADLAAALEARRAALEARLSEIGAESELARAWAQLAYLIPEGEQP